MLHRDLVVSDGIHVIHSWIVANAAALAALTLLPADIGKIAYQADTKQFWLLEDDVVPIWSWMHSPVNTSELPETGNLYFTAGRVLSTVLAGLSTAAGTVVTAAHTILEAIGFLQKQVSNNTASIADNTGAIAANTAAIVAKIGVPVGGIIGQVLAKNSNTDGDLIWNAAATGGGSGGREILTANRTYYVRVDGNDANTGLVDSAGGAFLTIQKAVDIISGTLDLNIFNITIQIKDGTYTGATVLKPLLGSGVVTIQGNAVTPANVLLNVAGACIFNGIGGSQWAVKNFKVQSTSIGLYVSGAGNALSYSNIVFGACTSAHASAQNGGFIGAGSNYSITAGSATHLLIAWGGNCSIFGKTITITGTPAFPNGFVYLNAVSSMLAAACTFVGAATGPRYQVVGNSMVDTQTGNTAYFPGSTGGVQINGGQYL